MLIEFTVGNFRSFHEPVTLSLQAAKLRAQEDRLNREHIFEADGLQLLRSAAVYGANASGKSNLVRALSFVRRLVLESSRESQAQDPIPVDRFRLSTAAREQPAHFEIVFFLDGVRYRYGFEVDGRRVCAEWLYHARQRETRLFAREEDRFELSSVFREGKGLEQRTRDNALFLSVVAQFNGPLATALLGWFRTRLKIVSGLNDASYGPFTLQRFQDSAAFRKRAVAFVREADLDISGIDVEDTPFLEADLPNGMRGALEQLVSTIADQRGQSRVEQENLTVKRVRTEHRVFDREHNPVAREIFDMADQESEGTKKIFFLSGPLIDVLEGGRVLVIDEMEARLHPLITRAVVQLFHSTQTNPHNAQLVFCTHDAGLLRKEDFRRDQVWFIEKDRYGASDLYSLAELKVRNDASYDKDYFAGKYGAVPLIGGLRGLFEEQPDGETA